MTCKLHGCLLFFRTNRLCPLTVGISQLASNYINAMVKELSYTTISAVIESWEQVKRMKNYEKVAGARLFTEYVVVSRCILSSYFRTTRSHAPLFGLSLSTGFSNRAQNPKHCLDFQLMPRVQIWWSPRDSWLTPPIFWK